MISRRRFFTGLIAAPIVMQASSLMPLRGVKMFSSPRVRSRKWEMRLAQDGVTEFRAVTGESMTHGEWTKSYINALQPYDLDPSLKMPSNEKIKRDVLFGIEEDAQLRVSPWTELDDLKNRLKTEIDYDLDVPIRGVVLSKGTWFETDVYEHHEENVRRRIARGQLTTAPTIVRRWDEPQAT